MAFVFILGALLAAIIIGAVAYYAYSCRHKICDEMTCMMYGMAFGTVASLVAGMLVGLYTGDFVWAMIIGTITGIAVGVPLGQLGGVLGRMEGVMAGPMGGLMGAMLGIMARPYDIELFVLFFYALLILVMAELGYLIYKRSNVKPSINHVVAAVFFAFITLELVYFLDFSSDISSAASAFSVASLNQEQATQQTQTTQNAQEQFTTSLEDGFQSISLKATPFGYDPNHIVARAGVPLRIELQADASAGCGRAISLPDFGIQKILTPGQKETIELSGEQLKPGTYRYQCYMAMMRGTLVVI